MRTLKLITKPLGLALLAGTLMSATPYAMNNSGNTEMSSISEAAETVDWVVKDNSGAVLKTYKLKVNVDVQKEYRYVTENGVVKKQEVQVESPKLEATVTTEGCAGCGQAFQETLAISPSAASDLAGALQAAGLGAKLAAFHNQKEVKEKELAKKRGDLEKRKAQAEKCLIVIHDEDDKSKDEKLVGKDKTEERLSCKAEKFNEKVSEGEFDSEREELAAFRKTFSEDIKALALSGDPDAEEILAEFAENLESDESIDYVSAVSGMARDNTRIFESAKLLNDPSVSAQSKLGITQSLQQAQQIYSQQPMGNGGRTQAIIDYRNELLSNINKAIVNPSSLFQDSTSIINDPKSGIRYNRIDGTGIPRPGQQSSNQNLGGNRLNRSGGAPQVGQQQQPWMNQNNGFQQQPNYNLGIGR